MPSLLPRAYTPEHSSLFVWGGMLMAFVLGFVSYGYLSADFPWTFLDGVNLIFHEAGHWLFAGMGMTMGIAGGTLLQLMIPGLLMGYFLVTREWLGFLFCWWWLGVNVVSVGVYMADANALALPLIGDGTHDWQWLFTRWGIIERAEILGGGVRMVGNFLILSALGLMFGKSVLLVLENEHLG